MRLTGRAPHHFAVDFEQPRALYQKVFSDTDREHLVHNIAMHLKNAKSAEVKARQRTSRFPLPSSPSQPVTDTRSLA